MDVLLQPIIIPFIIGAIFLFWRERKSRIQPVICILALLYLSVDTVKTFLKRPIEFSAFGISLFKIDTLSGFILVAICAFGLLISLYSFRFMQGKNNLNLYYGYILWTVASSAGAVLANNIILLLAFWGINAIILYLLINLGGKDATTAAKKTLITVGGADSVFILGIVIVWLLTNTFQMDKISILLNNKLATSAFLCIAIASFAKAGAMPFHNWIPDSSEVAPLPVMAFLPASLDKLLGIYLLARASLNMFVFIPNSFASNLLLIVGAITIVAAVMMALVQHNLKRLLSYHAVSQVGYMVLGIGTANPIGIAGGIFHMINHAIYKCCLFLTGGAVEHKTKTTELENLGGIARFMPITFFCCLIAAFAISGIPPLNGFVSKWMVYQGIIEMGKSGGRLWIIWLCAAMFGSALTLASFMKLIHATFLGQRKEDIKEIREVSFSMWFPMVVLALVCIIFGIFAFPLPLKHFIIPSVVTDAGDFGFLGFWNPTLATGLILIGIAIGLLIYIFGNLGKFREDESYIGGEIANPDERVTGVDFYESIRQLKIIKTIYKLAEKKFFDIYEVCKKIIFGFGRFFQYLHNGILSTYLVWTLLGMLALFWKLMR